MGPAENDRIGKEPTSLQELDFAVSAGLGNGQPAKFSQWTIVPHPETGKVATESLGFRLVIDENTRDMDFHRTGFLFIRLAARQAVVLT